MSDTRDTLARQVGDYRYSTGTLIARYLLTLPTRTGWSRAEEAMGKKNHNPGPVPPGNRPQAGPSVKPGQDEEQPPAGAATAPLDQEQDAKRRLGGFEGKGEHARQQPGRLNDGDAHSR
jgi:hypothetical protein